MKPFLVRSRGCARSSLVKIGCVLGALALAGACSSSDDEQTESDPSDGADGGGTDVPSEFAIGQQAPWPTQEWTVSTPEEMGMDSALIDEALDYAFENINPPSLRNEGDPEMFPFDTMTQAVVVARGGAIVAERYAGHPTIPEEANRDKDSIVASWSTAKSFTSTLIGILIDQGRIPDVNVKMSEYYTSFANDPAKAEITLRDVLQMSSGLDFSESYTDLECNVAGSTAECAEFVDMVFEPDQLAYMVERPIDPNRTTGQTWYYSSGDTLLLSGIVEQVTGKTAFEFAEEVLFGPIGMMNEPLAWWRDPAGQTLGYCCIDTTARNFAKFGLLFLRNGEWDGTQIVSEDWVTAATTDASAGNEHYAYQWWLTGRKQNTTLPIDIYAAEGVDDQRIYVIPSLDLVITRFSYYKETPDNPQKQIRSSLYSEFLLDGLTPAGTDTGAFFLECAFLAPIINSIEGAPKIENCNDAGGGDPNNPQPIFACRDGGSCMDRVNARYTPACDEFQGALCRDPELAAKMATCDDNCGCRAILECAFETQCFLNAAFDCLTPCQAVIDENGGVSGVPTTLVVEVALAFDAAAAAGTLQKTCP